MDKDSLTQRSVAKSSGLAPPGKKYSSSLLPPSSDPYASSNVIRSGDDDSGEGSRTTTTKRTQQQQRQQRQQQQRYPSNGKGDSKGNSGSNKLLRRIRIRSVRQRVLLVRLVACAFVLGIAFALFRVVRTITQPRQQQQVQQQQVQANHPGPDGAAPVTDDAFRAGETADWERDERQRQQQRQQQRHHRTRQRKGRKAGGRGRGRGSDDRAVDADADADADADRRPYQHPLRGEEKISTRRHWIPDDGEGEGDDESDHPQHPQYNHNHNHHHKLPPPQQQQQQQSRGIRIPQRLQQPQPQPNGATDDGAYGDDALARARVANAAAAANAAHLRREQQHQHQHQHQHTRPPSEEEEELDDQDPNVVMKRRLDELQHLEERMTSNTNTTVRWADMADVPPLPGQQSKKRRGLLFGAARKNRNNANSNVNSNVHVNRKDYRAQKQFFQVHRPVRQTMAWETEFAAIRDQDATARPDYVNYVEHQYTYPTKLTEPPPLGEYPKLRPYKEVLGVWPQDNLDDPPEVLHEDLIHFDWNDPDDMEAAVKFRNAKLPFKVINVPEVLAATHKWTDDYVAEQFDGPSSDGGGRGAFGWLGGGADTTTSNNDNNKRINRSNGKCNEGPDNFFAFFNVPLWDVTTLGIPPTRDNDWTFKRWANHARYADRVGLDPNLPHYYWQSGVPREERYTHPRKWTFVSKDLPSFSSTTANFIQWKPEAQKGIQCRFGERGITAANHYDSGRNMIAMITGAKRYILSPPKACKRLGIVSSKGHSSFRHSMLNYGHINLLDTHPDMPREERDWMERVGTADAVSTVLKEGEILYVPTGWFHYITSLQKSAQCNVRSGPDMSGDAFFGGADDIKEECFPHDD